MHFDNDEYVNFMVKQISNFSTFTTCTKTVQEHSSNLGTQFLKLSYICWLLVNFVFNS